MTFDGLGMHLGNLSRVSDARTRSISAENPTGAKGGGAREEVPDDRHPSRELGRGWKVRPCITVQGNETVTIAEMEGPGVIQHIWITVHSSFWRRLVLRMYWDDEETPSVEAPLGDFFANGWCDPANVVSLPISVNTLGGFNSYWEMPFRKRARITIENVVPDKVDGFFYQVTWTETPVPDDAAYFHAQWRRSNPVPYGEVHTLLDGVTGKGQYVGTYIAWGSNNTGWWGEGEIKFFMDGDDEFPTICGTGTEDYFGGAWCFVDKEQTRYETYTAPYLGFHQAILPDGLYRSQTRFGMYRWHVMDPIRFAEDLRVTIQALGWRSVRGGGPRFLALQDDLASTSFWYQLEPHASFPVLGDANALEVV